MTQKVKNASRPPRVLYGMHMEAGLAEYREGEQLERILINEATIKAMDPSFPGKPVYVHHVDEVDLKNLQEEADGYVVESFFNKSDGKHWSKFIIVSDDAHEAVDRGWKLSNAYIIHAAKEGGEWHGVPYTREITAGEYEHLAIVPNPRYEASIIMTPEQFKAYNEQKEIELKRLANSKNKTSAEGEEKPMALKFWKKAKVENSTELEGMMVQLPKSGKELELTKLVNWADDMEMNAPKAGEPVMCNGEHMVKVGDAQMSVNELVKKHMEMQNEMAKMKAPAAEAENADSDEEAKKKALELAEHEEEEIMEKKANGGDDEECEEAPAGEDAEAEGGDEEEEKPAEKSAEEVAAEKKANADKLRNAHKNAKPAEDVIEFDTEIAQLNRGVERYG